MGKLDMQEVWYGCYEVEGGLEIRKAFVNKIAAILYLMRNRKRDDFIRGWLEHGFEDKRGGFYD